MQPELKTKRTHKERCGNNNTGCIICNPYGITLIALVITIIVLLILAGVTLIIIMGENGVVTKSKQASLTNKFAAYQEEVKLKNIEMQMNEKNKSVSVTGNKIKDYIKIEDNDIEKFYIFSGELVYNPNNCSEQEIESAKYLNIKASTDYITIGTSEELKQFRDDVNNGNTYQAKIIYLINPIELNEDEIWQPIGYYPMTTSSPLAEENKPFSGTFDGCGNEISGIYINTIDKVQGLFGLVKNGTIKNLGIGENCNINGGVSTGGIAGYLYESNAEGCYNKGTITSENNLIGGITGQAYESSIKNCYNTGSITGMQNSVGGITGSLYQNSDMTKSYNLGTISGNMYVGGIIGYLVYGAKVDQSYNVGMINGIKWTGGVVGLVQDSQINECYNTGKVSGADDNVGGVCGKVYKKGLVSDSYNKGSVLGEKDFIGGVSGHNENSTIQNCYSLGSIEGTNATAIGGVVGKLTGDYFHNSNCYYLQGSVQNENIIEGIKSCAAEELKTKTEVLGSKWKVDTDQINEGYPILYWQS